MSTLRVTHLKNETSSSNNISLDTTGRVGINESTPDRELHVNSGNQNECAKFESTDTEVTLEFTDLTGTAALKCRNDFRFNTSSSTEICRIESGGNLQFNSGYGSVATAYGVRAWINFDGTAATIGTGRGSANMDAVTDNATADYTVNFTNDMPDANYAVLTGTHDYTTFGVHESTNPTVGAVRFVSRNPGDATALERDFYFVAIVR
jgi:hypothetical protein